MSRTRDPFALVNVLIVSSVVTVLVAFWVFVDLGGWTYYGTALRVRGYAPQHGVLKPSGTVAHLLGVVGFVMLTVPVIYSVRKHWTRASNLGSLATWLDVHIFCGIVGPILVTFHTSFKFNGIISVAYWSMVLVTLSGFVGRYLYVRIPKTIRGTELTHREIERRAAALTEQLGNVGLNAGLLARLEQRSIGGWWDRQQLNQALVADGVAGHTARDVVSSLRDRAVLVRRLRYLERTKRLFSAWHVFHQPLVYIMFGIAILHVGLALYMGYSLY